MKSKLLLCLALVLGGCAANKPAHPSAHGTFPGADQRAARTSPWGRMENGLRCRLTLPDSIEQGMSVPATIELQSDPTQLPAGAQKLTTFRHDRFLTLTLTEPKAGKHFEIKPFAFDGVPVGFTGSDFIAIRQRQLKPWCVHFPLVRAYSTLAPADYVCQVVFSYPTNPPEWVLEGSAFDPASWWHGTIISGTVDLRVLPETTKFQVFYIPKRLVVTKELTNLSAPDQPAKLAGIPVIRFLKADAQAVRLGVRNGHFLNTQIERNGKLMEVGGKALVPDWLNPIDQWLDYKGQDRAVDYRIAVFETAAPGGHLEFPGPGWPGYRVLWSRTFHVSLTGKEFQRLPAIVVNVAAGTDNRACVALIRTNPEVEQLSLAKTAITDGSLAAVGRLHHLRILYLYDTQITDTGLANLRNLIELKTLNLDGTKVTDLGLLRLRRLTHLEDLSLRNTAITDKGAAVVSGFPHLKQLDLSYTQIGNATMARLRGLKQLEWLDLTGTRVTGKGLQNITKLMHLRDLRVPATVSGEGLEAIKKAMPNCLVGFE